MKYFNHFLHVILGLVIVLTPSLNSGLFEFYNDKRILEGVILLVSSILFLKVVAAHCLNVSKGFKVTLITLTLLLLFRSLFLEYSSWAILEIGWYIVLVQLVFVLSDFYIKKPNLLLKVLLISLFTMALLYETRVIFTVIQAYLNPEWAMWPRINNFKVIIDGKVFGPNPFLGFANFRFLNHLHTWSIPVMIGGYLKYRKDLIPGFRILMLLILSMWWSLVFASGARGTSLGLMVSLILVLILYKREALQYLKYFLVTALIGLVIYFLGFELFHEKGAHTLIRGETQDRLDLWWAAYIYIIENPMFGIGPMHFSDINNPFQISSPHNMYLLWAAEWGIPALLLLIGIGFWLLNKWISCSRTSVSNLKISLTASVFAALVHSNVSGIFITPLSQLLGCSIVSIMIGIYYKDRGETILTPIKGFKFSKMIIMGVLLVINIITYSIFVSHIPDLKERRDQFKTEENETRMYPRFWDQGFIGND